MKKLLLTIFMVVASSGMAVSTFSATTTTGGTTASTTVSSSNDAMEIVNLQADINKMKLENTTFETDNKKLETEIKKLKSNSNLLLGATVLGAVGTGVGTAMWLNNRGKLKTKKATLVMLGDIETCVTKKGFDLAKDCPGFSVSSSEEEVKTCWEAMPDTCDKRNITDKKVLNSVK